MLTSRTLFFPEPAEAGYRCFVTEPCNDVLVGAAALRCGPPFSVQPGSAALGGAGLVVRLAVLVALVAGLLTVGLLPATGLLALAPAALTALASLTTGATTHGASRPGRQRRESRHRTTPVRLDHRSPPAAHLPALPAARPGEQPSILGAAPLQLTEPAGLAAGATASMASQWRVNAAHPVRPRYTRDAPTVRPPRSHRIPAPPLPPSSTGPPPRDSRSRKGLHRAEH